VTKFYVASSEFRAHTHTLVRDYFRPLCFCFTSVCFFIYVSCRAVVSAFLSSRHSSALYYFYCVVSVLINKVFVRSNVPSRGRRFAAPHLIYASLGPASPHLQTALRSVQPFWQSSRLWSTNGQTRRQITLNVATNRPHSCAMRAMRPNSSNNIMGVRT